MLFSDKFSYVSVHDDLSVGGEVHLSDLPPSVHPTSLPPLLPLPLAKTRSADGHLVELLPPNNIHLKYLELIAQFTCIVCFDTAVAPSLRPSNVPSANLILRLCPFQQHRLGRIPKKDDQTLII